MGEEVVVKILGTKQYHLAQKANGQKLLRFGFVNYKTVSLCIFDVHCLYSLSLQVFIHCLFWEMLLC